MTKKLILIVELVVCSFAFANEKFTISDWTEIYKGVYHSTGHCNQPRLEVANVLRIDLNEPGIRFFTTPSNGDEPLEVTGRTTVNFLKEHKLQIAVNAGFFKPWDKCCIDGEPKDIRGLAVSKGVVVSPPVGYGEVGSAVLLIDRANKVKISDSNELINMNDVYNAVSGIPILLSKGEIKVKEDRKPEPRTAAGVSKNGRYLYFIIIDGRQPGYSEGASHYETAEWLKAYGAYDALNLDGGGSAAMVRSDEGNGAIILNRPSGYKGEGGERVVGNNIGVYSE
ncbi:MAG: hypothetical protein A2Y10_18600 [Planctomycetes bacterium GWF2_41_51]|nr:MAG: hypothetical protein A2Y10_18600 [Planctomycetes bacterium GWF2_41_51]HBG27142.1 hypothetical protein [Phycisphaerales bacterium]